MAICKLVFWPRLQRLVTLSLFNRTGYLSRSLSSTTQSSEFLEESLNSQENDDLRSRIFRLRLPKRNLRMTKNKMTSRNYICILSSYLMLGHLKEVGEVIDQWKQSSATEFDGSACSRLLDAFAEVGLTEKAHNFHILLVEKNCDPPSPSK